MAVKGTADTALLKDIEVQIWPRGYKTVFMLNSTEHEISTAHKTKILTNKEVSCLKSLRC